MLSAHDKNYYLVEVIEKMSIYLLETYRKLQKLDVFSIYQ